MTRPELPVLTQNDSRIPSTCVHFHPTSKSLQHTGVRRNDEYELHRDVSCYSVCLNPVMADPDQPDRVAHCQCPTAHNDCMEYTPSTSKILGYASLKDADAIALTRRAVINGIEVYEVIRFNEDSFGEDGVVLNPEIIASLSVHKNGDTHDEAVKTLEDAVREAGANPNRDITWEEDDEKDEKPSYLEMVTSS